MSRFLISVLCAIAVAAISFESSGQSPVLNDPVSKLDRQIASGEVKLEFSRGGRGWLPSLLKNLDLNIDSQVLVFSKTSFQLKQISPRTPRALFFNDSVAIGSVQGGEVFEVTSLDPEQGVIYYTLQTREIGQPRFERQFEKCLNCHGPAQGLVVSSVFPGADGTPFITSNFFGGIDHSTPFDNRWGGWYVSGTHGSQRHMGNAVVHNSDSPLDLEEEGTQNLTSLAEKFDTTKYLAPTSDIVALMTLDHQAHMTNRIISLGQQFRRASRVINARETGEVMNRLDAAVDDLVSYMLFAEETPLREPIKGVSTFTTTFTQRGPRDGQGRSLRDFDLRDRLFRYPLSYMVYSEVFDAMPERARERVYQRLHDVLSGKDGSGKFARLSAGDRRAILEILRETKRDLPAYWR